MRARHLAHALQCVALAEPTPPDHLVSDPDEKHIGEPCKDSTGYCRYADKCDGGEQHDGLCPGSANVKCCVPPGAHAHIVDDCNSVGFAARSCERASFVA